MKVSSGKPSAGCSSRENVAAQQLAAQKAAATTLAVMNGGGPGDPPESTEPSIVIHVHKHQLRTTHIWSLTLHNSDIL